MALWTFITPSESQMEPEGRWYHHPTISQIWTFPTRQEAVPTTSPMENFSLLLPISSYLFKSCISYLLLNNKLPQHLLAVNNIFFTLQFLGFRNPGEAYLGGSGSESLLKAEIKVLVGIAVISRLNRGKIHFQTHFFIWLSFGRVQSSGF